ncbi:MAG: hypothetical protein KAT48_00945 [Bacteroidales bacterium]|nr:hypothetical protein [Bacteroidales bacterium]
MRKKLMNFTKELKLTYRDLQQIKGGRMDGGPGEIVDDDIDLPDMTAFTPGPGETVDDDIDLPDLTLNFLNILSNNNFC